MEFFTFSAEYFKVFIWFCFFQVGLSTPEAKVRDLFEHKDLGIYKKSFMAKVNPSGVVMVKLTPIHYEL